MQIAGERKTLDGIILRLKRLPEVSAVIVAGRDGMVVESDSSRRPEPRMFAAMAASIFGTSEMAVEELGQGQLREVLVESDVGTVIGIGAGENAILVVLIKKNSDIGLMLPKMRESAKETEDFLKSGEGRELLDSLHGRY